MKEIRSREILIVLMVIVGLSYQVIDESGSQTASSSTSTDSKAEIENPKTELKMKIEFDKSSQLYFTKLYIGSNQIEVQVVIDSLSRITWVLGSSIKNSVVQYSCNSSTTCKNMEEKLVYSYGNESRVVGTIVRDSMEAQKDEKIYKVDSLFLEVENAKSNFTIGSNILQVLN